MRRRRLFSSLALLLGGCSAGFLFLTPQERARREIPFSHLAHAKQELTCEICHAAAESEDRAGMPGKDVCLTCHEPSAEKPPKDYEKAIAAAAQLSFPAWNPLGDLVFSHRAHGAKGIACASCHGKVEESTELDEGVVARMEACVACHAREGKPNECATCHATIREDAPPRGHDASFLRAHGFEVRAKGTEEGRCALCHDPASRASCDACHAERPPADHDEFWRRRGHGFSAEVDRARCATCHREDTCLRCHLEVRPSTHVGAWGGRFSAHCFSCHLPLEGNACRACHFATPSHDAAPPKPPPPHPGAGADCRACHLPGTLLPHADNGTDCNACHR
ncbi:MAG TPA: hypothetical protein VFI25_09515 [Planctomycetota bacterium]|jgi:hypothetical protein|nr:hypothetical protein [Planctomycetota bacterium]